MVIAAHTKETGKAQKSDSTFEELYLTVRQHENRLITDNELRLLPDIDPSHIHYKEWQIRKRSAQRLITYLEAKNKALNILEIGCGNGWLASRLADIKDSTVIGLDINREEINQAKRVFKKKNLEFTGDRFSTKKFDSKKFDIILFAASIPYFGNLNAVLNDCLQCLNVNGEIHILDTHFYKQEDIDNAVNRMDEYYEEMGYPEMSDHYFHHSLKDIEKYNYRVIINPNSLFTRLLKNEPFYWIAITH